MENTNKKPKEELHEIMVEMFGMIEEMNTSEGQYLQFAEMFKQMNLNINRITEIKNIIIQNVYYQRYVKRTTTTIKRKRLTEAQKVTSAYYTLCSCGCYIHKDEHLHHIKNTLKHRQGVRNKKYSTKYSNPDDPQIDFEINREVLLQGFCIIHWSKISGVSVDTEL